MGPSAVSKITMPNKYTPGVKNKNCTLLIAVSVETYIFEGYFNQQKIKFLKIFIQFFRQMLKAPPLHSSDLHLSVIKCNCRSYEKTSFAILGT